MASTGAKLPTSGTSVSASPWSDNAWTSPGNVTAIDSTYASVTAATFDTNDQTERLRCTGFDFSAIPDGSTINGISVTIHNADYANGSGSIDLAQLVEGGTPLGDNKYATPQALTTTPTDYSLGGTSDLWGATLTTAIVKSSTFGIDLGCLATANNSDVFIDAVEMTVEYTAPPTSTTMDAESGSFSTTGSAATLQKRARLFYVIYPSAGSAPSAAQIKAGQDSTGASATASGWELARETTGEQIFASAASGLSSGTSYRVAFVWSDGTNDSNVVVSDSWSTTSTGTVLNAEVGVYSTTGADATLLEFKKLNAESTTFATSGAAATLLNHQRLNAESTTYSTTGADSTGIRTKVINAEVGSFTTTGAAATLLNKQLLNAESTTYSTVGADSFGIRSKAINAEAGSFSTTGADATLLTKELINAEAGTFSTTGAAATLLRNKLVNAEAGTYSTTGADATLVEIVIIPFNAESGSFTTTGSDVTFYLNQVVNAEAGSYATTGADATLTKIGVLSLNAEAGTFATSGAATTLLQRHILNSEVGSYSTSGAAASLYQIYRLNAEVGAYSSTGADATLLFNQLINAQSTTFSTTGADATLVKLSLGTLNAEAGSYSTTGATASLYQYKILNAASGTYETVGADATLSKISLSALNAEAGSFSTVGADVTFVAPTDTYSLNAEHGSFTSTNAPTALYYVTGNIARVNWIEIEYTPEDQSASYPGTYVSTFADGSLYWHHVLSADAGVYETTGAAATLTEAVRVFSLDPGEYTTIGIDATLTYFPGAIILNAAAGTYSTTGEDARLRKKRRIKPIADVTITDWTPSTGVEVFPTVNDLDTVTYSSTTKLRKPVEVLLEDAVAINLLETHKVRYTLRGNGFNKTRVDMLDGDNIIATWYNYNVPSSETEFEKTLTSTQLGLITDPSNLRLRATVKR